MFAPIALRFEGYNIPLEGLAQAYVQNVLAHPSVVAWIEAGKLEREVIAEAEI